MKTAIIKSWVYYYESPLIYKMAVGFFLGLAAAFTFGEKAAILSPLGDIFLNLLQMIVVPIIMLTLIGAVANANANSVARIAGKTFTYYLLTTAVAMILSLGIALMVTPGAGLSMPDANSSPPKTPSFIDQLVSIVPSNIFNALSGGHILALIFLALVVGLTISSMLRSSDSEVVGHGRAINGLVLGAKELIFRILDGILQYAPIGVFALVATQIGNQGMPAVIALSKLTFSVYIGLVAQFVLLYIPLLIIFRVSVVDFFNNCRDALITAFTTQSSSGTIPVSMKAAKNAGISPEVSGFVIPVGATVNMDGAIIRLGASVVLAANIVGIQLGFVDMAGIVLTATLISIGTAGIPGGGLIALTLLLTQAGLPLEIVALVAGVDVILGMGATMINVAGDMTGAHIIDKSEKGNVRVREHVY